MLYTSPWSRFELTISVVIGTDGIWSCKSNYHTIMATNVPLTLFKKKYAHCICSPGALIWLINLYYTITLSKKICIPTSFKIYITLLKKYICSPTHIRRFITNLQEAHWVDAKRNKGLLVSSADCPCWYRRISRLCAYISFPARVCLHHNYWYFTVNI
jgi:hypothetical protein